MTEPAPFTSEELAAGEQLFMQQWRFLKGVVDLAQLPTIGLIEIAFAGRSNVGKSSLINSLVRHRGLARTSNTPGRTQELNYFAPDATSFYIVDLPGYGFAKAPKEKVDAWTGLVTDYLRGRASLARVFLLIDARHGVKKVDGDIMAMLDQAAVSYQVVLTKSDKINPYALKEVLAETTHALVQHTAAYPDVLATSSETGEGIPELRAAIAKLLIEHLPP